MLQLHDRDILIDEALRLQYTCMQDTCDVQAQLGPLVRVGAIDRIWWEPNSAGAGTPQPGPCTVISGQP